MRILLIGVLALVVAGSAGAGHTKQKLVRVMKRHGAITATLTYTLPHYARVTLAVRRHGRVILRHRVPNMGPMTPKLAFRFVGGKTEPAAVVDSYLFTAIAVVSPRPVWIAHEWGRYGYKGQRIGGRYYFIATDNHFLCVYTSCAASWLPVQTWAIRDGRLVDVTRTVPELIRADAKRAWRWYLKSRHRSWNAAGIGTLAGWCGDEFLIGRGWRCERVLRQKLAAGELHAQGALSGRKFIRTLNRDLARWGYKRP